MSKADFDMILMGYNSDVPFEKASLKLIAMFEETIISNYGDQLEDFVTLSNSFIGSHPERGSPSFWTNVSKNLERYVVSPEREGAFVSLYLKLASRKGIKVSKEASDRVSKDIKNFSLPDICSVYLSLSHILSRDDPAFLKVEARATRDSNIERMTLEQAF